MGTRADYYVGRGVNAEWIGSTPFDGGLGWGTTDGVVAARGEQAFREAVAALIANASGTRPDQGWPWPWDSSATTDCAYAWDKGRVWFTWGEFWHDTLTGPDPDELPSGAERPAWPNMADRKNVTLGPRSGLVVITRV